MDATLCIASRNTRRSTELALRSVRATTPRDLRVWVGDCASTDGSATMLERLRDSGLVDRLDIAAGRSHGGWIDAWRAEVRTRWLVVADSDVELLRPGWLEAMVAHAESTGAALVSIGAHAAGTHTEPNTFTMRTVARPEMYLLLLDHARTEHLTTSFDFALATAPDGVHEAWDTGARFAADLEAAGLAWTVMPVRFAEGVTHWGALSYVTDPERLPRSRLARLRVRTRRLRIEARVARHLRAARPRRRG